MAQPTAQQWINGGLKNGYSFEKIRAKLIEENQWDSSVAQELKTQFEIAPGAEKTPEQQKADQLTNYALDEQIINAREKSVNLFKMATGKEYQEGLDPNNLGVSEGIKDATSTGGKVGAIFGRAHLATADKDQLIAGVENVLKDQTYKKLSDLKLGGASPGSNPSDADMRMIEASISTLTKLADTDKDGNIIGFKGSEENVKKELLRLKDSYDRALTNLEAQKKIISPEEPGMTDRSERIKKNLLNAYKDAKANPEDPDAQKFIENFKAGNFDINTGKLKEQFTEKTEEEKEFEEIYGTKTEQPTVETEQQTAEGEGEQEEKGILAETGGDIVDYAKDTGSNIADTTKNVYGSVKETGKSMIEIANKNDVKKEEMTNALGSAIDTNNYQMKSLSLANQFEEASKNAETDPKAKAFLENLSEEDKQRIDEFKDTPREERESMQKEIQENAKKIQEEIDKIAGGEYNQAFASTVLQEAGAFAGGIGKVAGDVTIGAIKQVGDTIKTGGKLALPEGAEQYIDEKSKETMDKALTNLKESEFGQDAINALQAGGEKWSEFEQNNPEMASNLKAVVQVVDGVTAAMSAGQTGTIKTIAKEGLEGAGKKVVKKGAGALATGLGVGAKGTGKVSGIFKGAKNITKETINKAVDTGTTDDLVGQIFRGAKTEEVNSVKNALKNIDVKDVKEASNLSGKFKENIKNLSRNVDDVLDADKTPRKLSELSSEFTTKAGRKVEENFLKKSLDDMVEMYDKAGDVRKKAEIEDLIIKAEKEGLTPKEINDIAREYNTTFGKKAFGKTGEALTSVNAQAYETTRKQVKDLARSFIKGDEAKMLDGMLHDTFTAKRIIDKNVEAVNLAKQKLRNIGIGEKIVGIANDVADYVTLGATNGAKKAFLGNIAGKGRNINMVEWEEQLAKNLKKFKKLENAGSEKEAIEILNEIAKDLPKENRKGIIEKLNDFSKKQTSKKSSITKDKRKKASLGGSYLTGRGIVEENKNK